MTQIRTDRLLLRKARESDLAPLHAIFSDPETMRYWSTPPHADLETTRCWLAAMIDLPASTGDDYIVELDGRVIGKLGLWQASEIGFLLSRDTWGQGLGREALSAFVAHAFRERADHLTADVDPGNAACLALLKRVGFRETGRATRTWTVGDQWCDSVYLRLDRDRPRPT
ncbi:acetyltransferase [Caulobacter sp. Root655]|uniref:GNAT family N-acetyltransferase n=1 Tax=Caulobacter sp. Root655 TaxID=1736578 RepID=UPI0006F604EB|nr:GNAT family N-acetyltransferase [Caulobacter sp. Root655]KRA66482.1 acetyltransferase [Caulobacter sp. Root655]